MRPNKKNAAAHPAANNGRGKAKNELALASAIAIEEDEPRTVGITRDGTAVTSSNQTTDRKGRKLALAPSTYEENSSRQGKSTGLALAPAMDEMVDSRRRIASHVERSSSSSTKTQRKESGLTLAPGVEPVEDKDDNSSIKNHALTPNHNGTTAPGVEHVPGSRRADGSSTMDRDGEEIFSAILVDEDNMRGGILAASSSQVPPMAHAQRYGGYWTTKRLLMAGMFLLLVAAGTGSAVFFLLGSTENDGNAEAKLVSDLSTSSAGAGDTALVSSTASPIVPPTSSPSFDPSSLPTTATPTHYPTTRQPPVFDSVPTKSPVTPGPTGLPTMFPSSIPTLSPTISPTSAPTRKATQWPTVSPTISPTSPPPTRKPTQRPTASPVIPPTNFPTLVPSPAPTRRIVTSPVASSPSSAPKRQLGHNCYPERSMHGACDVHPTTGEEMACMLLNGYYQCARALGGGETCGMGWKYNQCRHGLWCPSVNGVCRNPAPEIGEPCASHIDFDARNICGFQGFFRNDFCRAFITSTVDFVDSCTPDTNNGFRDCAADLTCEYHWNSGNAYGTCMSRASNTNGVGCNGHHDCADGYSCRFGLCRPYSQLGQSCATQPDCSGNLYCDPSRSNTCQLRSKSNPSVVDILS